MLLGGATRDALDPTPVKRARSQAPQTLPQKNTAQAISMSSLVNASGPKVVIQTVPAPAAPAVVTQKRRDTMVNIIQTRFKRALRKNDATMLKRCIESGYNPTVLEWLHMIQKMHVKTSMACIDLVRKLDAACVGAAIRRQHSGLWKKVIARVSEIPPAHIDGLLAVPAYFLGACLEKGLDPNTRLKNKRLPLEHACAHSRIAHVEILLKDERTTVSQNVCRFMMRQSKQQRFAVRALELCTEVVPDMILEAVVANVTPALRAIMAKVEPQFESSEHWESVRHMLLCPLLYDYSTDLVKTPENDHYYDRASLLKWVRTKGTDPLTRETLAESELLLRSEFLKEYATTLQQNIKQLT